MHRLVRRSPDTASLRWVTNAGELCDLRIVLCVDLPSVSRASYHYPAAVFQDLPSADSLGARYLQLYLLPRRGHSPDRAIGRPQLLKPPLSRYKRHHEWWRLLQPGKKV